MIRAKFAKEPKNILLMADLIYGKGASEYPEFHRSRKLDNTNSCFAAGLRV